MLMTIYNLLNKLRKPMYKRIRIFPYKIGSESARDLARELGTLCVKHDGNYVPRQGDLVVNWGNSSYPTWMSQSDRYKVLNLPRAVKSATNKIVTLTTLSQANVPTVKYTTNRATALSWGIGNIVERKVLNGHSGDGVHIPQTVHDLGYSDLYTRFVPEAREYRVHVFNGVVIDLQQKKRREGTNASGRIKNLANGWVFCRDDITRPPVNINKIAIRAVRALGLDFGAVDIIVKDGNCLVLEVNTACGLQGETLTNYVNAIRNYGR